MKTATELTTELTTAQLEAELTKRRKIEYAAENKAHALKAAAQDKIAADQFIVMKALLPLIDAANTKLEACGAELRFSIQYYYEGEYEFLTLEYDSE